jgi:hypothetical protein
MDNHIFTLILFFLEFIKLMIGDRRSNTRKTVFFDAI